MGLLDRFKKWLRENEGEFKDSSDKATAFLEELGQEIGYAGSKVAKSAEDALRKFDKEYVKKETPEQKEPKTGDNVYENEPGTETGSKDYFDDDEEDYSVQEPLDEATKEVSQVEKLMENIDELIAELKKEEEQDVPDPRDHKTAIERDWKGMDDDFMKKAMKFADRNISHPGKSSSPEKDTGKVKGFKDRDNDGDEIIDDAEIDDSE